MNTSPVAKPQLAVALANAGVTVGQSTACTTGQRSADAGMPVLKVGVPELAIQWPTLGIPRFNAG